ncbi:MAG: hypothetical protein KF893_11855 [Caldilineaceae bacterium]|nr:hypothetical protein [Caldilineaceae bacterium]
MAKQPNRNAIILSAFFTAFLLTLFVGGYVLWQGWGSGVAGATNRDPLLEQQTQPAPNPDPGAVTYQSELEQAYSALNEAYAQIETLQAQQSQLQPQRWEDDDDDHDDDEHNYTRGKDEHDDD